MICALWTVSGHRIVFTNTEPSVNDDFYIQSALGNSISTDLRPQSGFPEDGEE